VTGKGSPTSAAISESPPHNLPGFPNPGALAFAFGRRAGYHIALGVVNQNGIKLYSVECWLKSSLHRKEPTMADIENIFDFVTDQGFKDCLQADYSEFKNALGAEMHKSALILAGSIVEALLVDYLVFSDYKTREGKDPLRMDLWQAIDACMVDGMLSSRTASLCNVLREYRNVIHPGRMIRLGEKADRTISKVAEALLDTVIADTAAKRRETYGYTAEQIVAKVQRDPECRHLLSHLLKDCAEYELERLLLLAIPEQYFLVKNESEWQGYDDSGTLDALSHLYGFSFKSSSDSTKRKVMTRYASIVKEESGNYVQDFEDAFGTTLNLDYAEPDVFDLLVDRVRLRLKGKIGAEALQLVISLPRNAKSEWDMPHVVDPIVNAYVQNPAIREAIRDSFFSALWSTVEPQTSWLHERIDTIMERYQNRGMDEAGELVKELKTYLIDPFAEV
jgi:hypothetical protein